MTSEQLRDRLHQTPFKPFTIRMADGRAFHVPHPDFVALSPTGRIVIVFGANNHYSDLDLRLMTELEVHAPDNRAT